MEDEKDEKVFYAKLFKSPNWLDTFMESKFDVETFYTVTQSAGQSYIPFIQEILNEDEYQCSLRLNLKKLNQQFLELIDENIFHDEEFDVWNGTSQFNILNRIVQITLRKMFKLIKDANPHVIRTALLAKSTVYYIIKIYNQTSLPVKLQLSCICYTLVLQFITQFRIYMPFCGANDKDKSLFELITTFLKDNHLQIIVQIAHVISVLYPLLTLTELLFHQTNLIQTMLFYIGQNAKQAQNYVLSIQNKIQLSFYQLHDEIIQSKKRYQKSLKVAQLMFICQGSLVFCGLGVSLLSFLNLFSKILTQNQTYDNKLKKTLKFGEIIDYFRKTLGDLLIPELPPEHSNAHNKIAKNLVGNQMNQDAMSSVTKSFITGRVLHKKTPFQIKSQEIKRLAFTNYNIKNKVNVDLMNKIADVQRKSQSFQYYVSQIKSVGTPIILRNRQYQIDNSLDLKYKFAICSGRAGSYLPQEDAEQTSNYSITYRHNIINVFPRFLLPTVWHNYMLQKVIYKNQAQWKGIYPVARQQYKAGQQYQVIDQFKKQLLPTLENKKSYIDAYLNLIGFKQNEEKIAQFFKMAQVDVKNLIPIVQSGSLANIALIDAEKLNNSQYIQSLYPFFALGLTRINDGAFFKIDGNSIPAVSGYSKVMLEKYIDLYSDYLRDKELSKQFKENLQIQLINISKIIDVSSILQQLTLDSLEMSQLYLHNLMWKQKREKLSTQNQYFINMNILMRASQLKAAKGAFFKYYKQQTQKFGFKYLGISQKAKDYSVGDVAYSDTDFNYFTIHSVAQQVMKCGYKTYVS